MKTLSLTAMALMAGPAYAHTAPAPHLHETSMLPLMAGLGALAVASVVAWSLERGARRRA